jgi:hypothetical protein
MGKFFGYLGLQEVCLARRIRKKAKSAHLSTWP